MIFPPRSILANVIPSSCFSPDHRILKPWSNLGIPSTWSSQLTVFLAPRAPNSQLSQVMVFPAQLVLSSWDSYILNPLYLQDTVLPFQGILGPRNSH